MLKAEIKFTTDPVSRLDGVNKTLQKRSIARAVKEAIKPVVDAVTEGARAVQDFGYLAQSIGQKVKSYKTATAGIVGPKSKFRKRKGVRTRGKDKGNPIWHRPAFYAALVERGTSRSKAKPFLKPALDATKDEYMETVAENIKDELEKLL